LPIKPRGFNVIFGDLGQANKKPAYRYPDHPFLFSEIIRQVFKRLLRNLDKPLFLQ